MHTGRQILIGTLGKEPQVMTLALDLLHAKGCAIEEVIAPHTAGEAMPPALARLREEFATPGTCTFRRFGAGQLLLVPPDTATCLPEGHLAGPVSWETVSLSSLFPGGSSFGYLGLYDRSVRSWWCAVTR
jgi:hypothetical protein